MAASADTARLLRITGDGRVIKAVGKAPGPTWVWTGRSQVPVPFTINTPIAVTDSSVMIADGPAYRVRVYRAGTLAEIFGVDREPNVVDQAAKAAYTRFVDSALPEPLRPEYAAALSSPAVPRWQPGYQAVTVDSDGRIWAQIYSANPLSADTWDVYSPRHEWLGTVRAHAFAAGDAAGALLAGVWRDELGVEYVRVLRLIDPGST